MLISKFSRTSKLILYSLLPLLLRAAEHPTAKNEILFIGDGAGISSLNAASIYGYGQPQALYVPHMPNLALADTSTISGWVTDGAAAATAMATGKKTANGVVSQTPPGTSPTTPWKTILEYAEEHGLSTGIISNEDRAGVSDAVVSAFYAHAGDRQKSGDIFQQILKPKFGDGLDIAIGSGRKKILAETSESGYHLKDALAAHGYAFVDSLDTAASLPPNTRLVMLTDDEDFDLRRAVNLAVDRLKQNPKGYLLVAFSDCHLPSAKKTLSRIVQLDATIREIGEQQKSNTLVLFTADHSFDLRVKGEHLTETAKSIPGASITSVVSLEDEHTAEEVPLLAEGPGSETVHGFLSNTDVFGIMLKAYGWPR